jgi:DNA (cytosine-5)-methyltransferase 1
MKYLSLFSGIGGMELGIGPEHECVGYSEIDKYATQIYQSHFPTHKNYGDITKINASELPDFDLLVGGFPCQAFSIAGKRKGFDDTRGTLFFEIARILQTKRPRLFLLENVKGLLSHDNGATFSTIISTLDELGYDLQWQVLNSKNHGVPQNRERVFIVGHLRGTRRPEVFPFGESKQNSYKSATEVSSISPPITTQGGKNCRGVFIQQFGEIRESEISPTLRTPTGGHRLPLVIEEMKVRRLTPTECERLQGFPDGWTIGVSDSQRYKTLGNAVTVNVIRDIMKKLLPNE